MSAKGAVNSFVSKVSGYHLTKANPGEADAEITRQREKIVSQRARIQRLTTQLADAKAAAAQPRRSTSVANELDENTREIVRAVRDYTLTGVGELHALISATRYVARHKIPGDIVQCGVWRGGSMQAVARTLIECADTTRDLYLFDTFESVPARPGNDGAVRTVGTVDDVQTGFATVPYPAEKLHLVKGKVADTIPAQAPETISILRLDTGWDESTAHELAHLWDRLSSGGVLLIDDYGQWQGSRLATDAFLDRTGARLLLVPVRSARVAVKP